MNVLVIDIGGTHVKVLVTGQNAHREFDSGPDLTPKRMINGVRKLVADWKYKLSPSVFPDQSSGTGLFRSHGILEKGGPGSISNQPSNVPSGS